MNVNRFIKQPWSFIQQGNTFSFQYDRAIQARHYPSLERRENQRQRSVLGKSNAVTASNGF